MPIYEYQCSRCDHEFELLLKSAKASSRSTCPSCGSGDVARRLSVFAASSGTSGRSDAGAGAGCGRCGDPNGPCGF